MEELECEDVYVERIIGAKNLPWRNKKCPSCKLGFNAKSKPSKCYGCDSFSHSKPSCFNKGVESPHFYCKVCAPVSETSPTSKETSHQFIGMTKTDNGWKCDKCQLKVKTSYSMKRHIERKHAYQVHSESILVTYEPLVSEVSLCCDQSSSKHRRTTG